MSAQLPLNLRLKDSTSFENFLPAANREAVAAVRGLAALGAAAQRPPVVFLWGEAGSGKSHLLQAACRLAHACGGRPAYVALGEAGLVPAMLEDMEQAPLVCVDDCERAAGDADWERALFTVCERLRETGGALVAAGRTAPAALGLRLPDLATRLAWGPIYHLQPLTDADKLEAVRLRARNRGFEIATEVARYILERYPRDLNSLFALLDRIDVQSLAAQRRVTIPFVRELIG